MPTDLVLKISPIEIFDTKNFIDSNVIVKFGNILNNIISMNLKNYDELIKLNYQGIVDVI